MWPEDMRGFFTTRHCPSGWTSSKVDSNSATYVDVLPRHDCRSATELCFRQNLTLPSSRLMAPCRASVTFDLVHSHIVFRHIRAIAAAPPLQAGRPSVAGRVFSRADPGHAALRFRPRLTANLFRERRLLQLRQRGLSAEMSPRDGRLYKYFSSTPAPMP